MERLKTKHVECQLQLLRALARAADCRFISVSNHFSFYFCSAPLFQPFGLSVQHLRHESNTYIYIYTLESRTLLYLCRMSFNHKHNKFMMADHFLGLGRLGNVCPQALALPWKMPHVPWRPWQSARRSALPAQHFDAPKVCHCSPAPKESLRCVLGTSTQVASSFGLE